ncbi:hypothetical protein NDU88_004101 [Pleurodeles waltl]|uniref:Uncharacterized protein n=1 Tax=Pleurodeles waltl TaxID=8319 RepID=A0AAV7KWR8_PLEWA|nr:hypothetical protein NDU88_004101 [Pleurodeles waltl]
MLGVSGADAGMDLECELDYEDDEEELEEKVKHVPGADNNIADTLSHSQPQRFCSLAPGVDVLKTQIPLEVKELAD